MLKKEIRFFGRKGNKRDKPWTGLRLSTTAPSSKESEKAFSATNQMCTKISSSWNYDITDCYVS